MVSVSATEYSNRLMTSASESKTSLVTSVIVPALNEEKTIQEVIERLLNLQIPIEVIVVNDGSTDQTGAILATFGDKITLITNDRPSGKGSAIRKALEVATGSIIAIQDADLEYRPEEIVLVLLPILQDKADFVLGTRFFNGYPKSMALPNKIVNILLAFSVKILFGKKITDEATCYKAIRRTEVVKMNLECTRFEFCPEVVSKAIRMNLRIVEVPISYVARSKSAGKKIRWTDAPKAFMTLLKYRFWKPL